MSRETELHFGAMPGVEINRSKFNMNYDHKTTFNEGELVPIFLQEYLPGDTAKIDLASLVRMSTPIYPVMDNAVMDIYFFSCPNRLLWNHFINFMGENTESYWAPEVEYTMPQTKAPEGGWSKGTIADHLGLPIGVENISVSSLPFRMYAKCYNDWFRSENLIEPLDMSTDDSTTTGSNGTDDVTDCQKGGMPVKVGRLTDYFSACLPSPQKSGADVYIPLGSSAPIIGTDNISSGTVDQNLVDDELMVIRNDSYYQGNLITGLTGGSLQPNKRIGLAADLSNATAATISQLRQAFAVQRMYEKDALYGSKYIESILGHFGVHSPDARQQRSEYLGGARIPINITQVVQTSSTDSTTPQGNTAAMSLTINNDGMFTKSFTEHGYIMGFACIRVERSYQQGIEKHWSRKNRFDFYYPSFANLSNLPVLNKEIYAQGTTEDEEVFGYQEAWAEYRYKPNTISGELRSTYATPLDSWHYGDNYNSLPVLGKTWFEEGKDNIGRTLAVQNQDQFIADFYFKMVWTRPMPMYSVPGLIDHN